MGGTGGPDVTRLLQAWGAGEPGALEQLAPAVFSELHRVAARFMRNERPGHTLQTTALVNEAYVRLVDGGKVRWQDRAHFFAVAANMMRRILVDRARARTSAKRGGVRQRVPLEDGVIPAQDRDGDLIALDDALRLLAKTDRRKARVIELRFFGGLSVEETAEVLKVSTQTVLRDWNLAKAWLAREMKSGSGE
jgi:RNA polymerase sigma-70 factor (ECF subfamily)